MVSLLIPQVKGVDTDSLEKMFIKHLAEHLFPGSPWNPHHEQRPVLCAEWRPPVHAVPRLPRPLLPPRAHPAAVQAAAPGQPPDRLLPPGHHPRQPLPLPLPQVPN